MAGHPVCGDRPTAADDSKETSLRFDAGDTSLCDATVNGNEIDAIFSIFFDHPKHVIGTHLHDCPLLGKHLSRRLINGNRSDHQRRGLDDCLPDGPDIPPRGEIHQGIRARSRRDSDFLQLQIQIDAISGCPDVGVDLCPESFADRQGWDVLMGVVTDHHKVTCFNALTDEFGGYPLLLGADPHFFRYRAFFRCF